MNLKHELKFSALIIMVCSLAFVPRIDAQQENRQTSAPARKRAETAKNDDLSITANVTARELKFEIAPNPTVEFFGNHERRTVWEADRQNLPRPVEPGVTYRNIGVQLCISSRFADIERIVAEALGEIPVSEAAPQNQTPDAAVQPKTSAPQNQNKKP